MRALSQARLPGHVPVEPAERSPDHWTLVPTSGHDFAADRLSSTAQSLAQCRRLKVPGPAAQEMDTVAADTYLGMVAQVDQGILGSDASAAPACTLVCLADRCLSLSAHRGSHLLVGSLGARGSAALKGRPPLKRFDPSRNIYESWASPARTAATTRVFPDGAA